VNIKRIIDNTDEYKMNTIQYNIMNN